MNKEPIAVLKDNIVSALRECPCLREICLFGSMAKGTHDQYSDIDMFVNCGDAEESRWSAARGLRAGMDVLYYRSFTSAAQPSGRYWFKGVSPFHRLDISFHCSADYERVFRGETPGYVEKPFVIALRRDDGSDALIADAGESISPLDVT